MEKFITFYLYFHKEEKMKKLMMVTICCIFLSSASYAINVSHIVLNNLSFSYDPGHGFGGQFNDYQVFDECLVPLPAKTWNLGTVLLTRIDDGPTPEKDYYIARKTNGNYLGYLVGPDNGQLIGAITLDGATLIYANWSVTLSSNAGMFRDYPLCDPN